MATSPTTFAPTGYCRCGYPTDPGVCPECGRTNRRVRRWNPRGVAARRLRWLTRIIAAATLMSGLFFGGKHILWNWWPLEQIHYLAALPGSGWWSTQPRELAESVLDHRLRRLFDLAHARYEVLRNLPLPTRDPHGASGRYTDSSRTLFLHQDEFVISRDPGPGGLRDEVEAYGAIVKHSNAELLLRTDWSVNWTRLPPASAPKQEIYVKGLLFDTPLLIQHVGLNQYLEIVRLSRIREYRWSYLRYPGVFAPQDVPDSTAHRSDEGALQLPSEYCNDDVRNLRAYVQNVSTATLGPQLWRETITLDVGSSHGVRPHLTFFMIEPDSGELRDRFRVTRTDELSCCAERILPGYLMDPSSLRRIPFLLPEVGIMLQAAPE